MQYELAASQTRNNNDNDDLIDQRPFEQNKKTAIHSFRHPEFNFKWNCNYTLHIYTVFCFVLFCSVCHSVFCIHLQCCNFKIQYKIIHTTHWSLNSPVIHHDFFPFFFDWTVGITTVFFLWLRFDEYGI